LNVYVAGKIRKNDWRLGLPLAESEVNGRGPVDSIQGFSATGFPIIRFVKAGISEHSYTGPFFISCDHGCYHGENDHGLGTDSGGDGSVFAVRQQEVVRLCKEAVDRADVVFCWVDDPTIYGSLFELGYAHAKQKDIWIAGPERISDHWFAEAHADRVLWGVTDPVKTLELLLAHPRVDTAQLAELARIPG
jgi:hypothetical protein